MTAANSYPDDIEALKAWLERDDGCRKIVNYHLIPQFGMRTLADLKRTDFRDWLDTLDCTNKRDMIHDAPARCEGANYERRKCLVLM